MFDSSVHKLASVKKFKYLDYLNTVIVCDCLVEVC